MTYKYKALSADGMVIKGVMDAADEYSAVTQIRELNQIIIQIVPVRKLSKILSKEIGPRQIDYSALAVLCSHFSMLLCSGIPVTLCVELIAGQMENRKLKKILEETKELMEAGYGLADSLEEADKAAFPPAFLEMVQAGEKSGTLERSFEKLSVYYEKRYKMKQKISTAMIYPMFVLTAAATVVLIVMGKVLPVIFQVFEELEGELPLSTKILIAVSDFFQNHLFHGLIWTLALIVAVLCYNRTEKGRSRWHSFKLKVPVLGKIRLLSASGHFAHTVSAMLGAGMTLPRALEITARTIENDMLARETRWMSEKLEEGWLLGECMREKGCYPQLLNEVCSIGEESGELEGMLASIGDYFDSRVDDMAKKAAVRLEPMVLIGLAGLTGFIVISIYLPLFSMYSLM